MIAHNQTISFRDDRTPRAKEIRLGFEGDNMVERLEFVLPVIADGQTATLMMGGTYTDAVTLNMGDNGRYAVNLTKEIIGTDGEVEAYVRIDGSGGEVWQSGVMRLVTGELPDVETEIETRFPTAVETMLTEMEGHRTEMAGTLTEAQAAAERAEAAAGVTPHIGSNGNWYIGNTDTGRPSRGEQGRDGQDGYTPVKGVDYFDGQPGATGATGPSGKDGSNGTSVTVKNVSTSSADGGSNVVTFSDGKTLTVKNGSKGSTGATGPTGPSGQDGKSGVHVGSDQPGGDANVWIDPDGDATMGFDDFINEVIAALPRYNGEAVDA